MSIFSDNLKLLRAQHELSQKLLAQKLYISRANLAKYEGAVHEPSHEVLIRMSRYFEISIDVLLTVDLAKLDDEQIHNLREIGKTIFPIKVNEEGNNVIEVVPHNAQAGYAGMYSDVGFIESLDHFDLPFLQHYGKCRAFPIEGDSMPPFGTGSYVIGEYISSKNEIVEGKRYILLHRDEGIVFKRLYLDAESAAVILHSDNPKYKPFHVDLRDVLELWQYVAAIVIRDSMDHYLVTDMLSKIGELQEDLQSFTTQFSDLKN